MMWLVVGVAFMVAGVIGTILSAKNQKTSSQNVVRQTKKDVEEDNQDCDECEYSFDYFSRQVGTYSYEFRMKLEREREEEKARLERKYYSPSILERQLEYSRDIIAFKNSLRNTDPTAYERLFGNRK